MDMSDRDPVRTGKACSTDHDRWTPPLCEHFYVPREDDVGRGNRVPSVLSSLGHISNASLQLLFKNEAMIEREPTARWPERHLKGMNEHCTLIPRFVFVETAMTAMTLGNRRLYREWILPSSTSTSGTAAWFSALGKRWSASVAALHYAGNGQGGGADRRLPSVSS